MSTTSMIWVKVREEDFGKVLTADITKLPNPVTDMNFPCKPVKIHSNPGGNILYMGIYCNFDGYSSGVGKELMTKFTTYEQVLNLILLGECSYIIDDIRTYHNWRNEDLHIRYAEFGKPKSTQDFFYLFEDGKWSTIPGDNYTYKVNTKDI